MDDKSVYKRIKADIINMISSGKIKPGEKIPSLGNIQDEYKVSHMTALRVQKELFIEKHVDLEKGKGYFARTVDEQKPRTDVQGIIACFTRPSRETTSHDNYFNEINQSIQNESMKRTFGLVYPHCNYRLFANFKNDETQNIIKDTVLKMEPDVDGFFLDERVSDRIVDDLKKKICKPMCMIGRATRSGIDSVAPDNEDGARQAALLCLKMSYEFFFVGRNGLSPENCHERTDSFIDELLKNGISSDRIMEFEYCIGSNEETWGAVEKNWNDSLKTMVFVPNDHTARWIADLLYEKNGALGKMAGVLGYEGMGYATMRKPHLTTVDVKPIEMGAKAAEVLIGRINGTVFGGPEKHVAPSTFKMGETI